MATTITCDLCGDKVHSPNRLTRPRMTLTIDANQHQGMTFDLCDPCGTAASYGLGLKGVLANALSRAVADLRYDRLRKRGVV